MTDDEIRAEVNAMLASGDNGEGAAIESDLLWAAFDKFWNTLGSAFLTQTFNDLSLHRLRDQLGAAFEAGWDAHADVLKAGKNA